MAFKRGFKAVSEEKKRQDKAREARKKSLWRLFLSEDGDEADIEFLTEQPINFEEHTKKVYKNGKEHYLNIVCAGAVGKTCEECDNGDKPTFKSAWLIIDHRPFEYTDSKGKKKKGTSQLKLLVQGTRVASQLDRLSKRNGLVGRMYTMVRLGSGNQTTYTFETGDENEVTSEEIENLLPEALRKDYDGNMESLYDIIEEQLVSSISEGEEEDEDEGEDEEDETISIEEDDEEEYKPKKSSKFSDKKLSKNKSKPSSVKKVGASKITKRKSVDGSIKKTSVKKLIKNRK